MKKDQRVLAGAAGADFILVLIKTGIGLLTGSLGLIADALHSFADILARLAAWVGVTLSQKQESRKFPLGLHKLEDLVALGISLLILLLGVNTALEALKRLIGETPELQDEIIGIAFALLAACISFGMSLVLSYVNKGYESPILLAVGKDYRMDSVVTITVSLGLGLSIVGFPIADSLVCLIVSGLVIFEGFIIARDAILVLLDASLDQNTLENLRGITETVQQVSVENIAARRAGRFMMATITVAAPSTLDLHRTHILAKEIEATLLEEISKIDRLTVIVRPSKKDTIRIAIPLEEEQDLDSPLSDHFGATPYIAFVDIKKGEEISLSIEKNPHSNLERRRGVQLAEFIIGHDTDSVYCRIIPKKAGAVYALGDAGIPIKKTEAENLRDAIKELEKANSSNLP